MKRFKQWLDYAQQPGPDHVPAAALPTEPVAAAPVSMIAYYLPQFHAIPENDEWWGEGFTEWTNVTRAMPRYEGHYQPRRPDALGYYDLRNPEVMRRQGELAKRGGLRGFCFHYYWFSGREVLDTPIRNLLADPSIDISFCIDWANENWTRRWDGGDQTVLLKQDYHDEDPRRLADSLAPMLADPRYIRNDGRPLLMVYRPDHVPAPQGFFTNLRRAIGDLGLGDPFLLVPDAFGQSASALDFDAAAGFPPHGGGSELRNDLIKMRMFDVEARGLAIDYDALIERILHNEGHGRPLFPGVCPSWDNEARRGVDGVSFYGASPAKYGRWLQLALEKALREQRGPDRFVFINAWNEWAEGAYLEPDRHYGYAYLAQTRQALERVIAGTPAPAVPPAPAIATKRNLIVNRLRSARDDAFARVKGPARS